MVYDPQAACPKDMTTKISLPTRAAGAAPFASMPVNVGSAPSCTWVAIPLTRTPGRKAVGQAAEPVDQNVRRSATTDRRHAGSR